MKSIYVIIGLVFLPLLFFFDLVIFFGLKTNVTCLTCDLSAFFRSSSMSFLVLSSAWQSLQQIYKRI